MSNREEFPGDRGFAATGDVAGLLAAMTLPSIEPFGPDTPALAGLPAYIPFPPPVPEPASRVGVARVVYDTSMTALAVLKRLEDATAACKAALVARVIAAAHVEADATNLDPWQAGIADSSACTDIALTLCIPERTAAALAHHSTALLTTHHHTLTALQAGEISYRHAALIVDECNTLNETPTITTTQVNAFEARLLHLAPGTTASGFASKARRARENTHPETRTTATKQAYQRRAMTLEPGRDGMSWLTLHLPTISAQAAWVNCTRTARTIKHHNPPTTTGVSGGSRAGEHRTLAQLRLDIATTLLLNQQPLPGNSGSKGSGSSASSSNAEGGGTTGTRGNRGQDQEDGPDPSSQGNDVPFGSSTPFGVHLLDDPPPWEHHNPTPPQPATTGAINPGSHHAAITTSHGNGHSTSHDTSHGTSHGNGHSASGGGVGDVPVVGELLGDDSGFVDGVVDGIPEDPEQDYLDQLEILRHHQVMIDPPLPKALILLTVPFLSALNITDEPAELIGSGPVPVPIAQKLLANSPTFLRVLTDPVTDEPLDLKAERYTLRESEKALLRALAGGCYFPNCPNPVMDTDTDHLKAYEHGGKTTLTNQRPACQRHHLLKHFKDDKTRHGHYRREHDPERTKIRLRGWKPLPTTNGTTAWLSPSGNYHRPQHHEPRPPAYPKWLKKRLNNALNTTLNTRQNTSPTTSPTTNLGPKPTITSPLEQILINYTNHHKK